MSGDVGMVQVPESTPMMGSEENEENKAEQTNEEEILIEIPTYNFTVLFCGLMIGLGVGYIIWVFVRKEMILWAGAALGLLIGRILEVTLFSQNVVQIWTPKSSVELTQVPKWKEELRNSCDFFVQSDMYDIDQRYVRSTAVYHFPNTNALTVQERFVKRKSFFKGGLFFSSPIGGAISFIFGLACSAIWYLRENIDQNISLFIICVVVLVPIIVLIGCLVEVELRKKRFLSHNMATETVTNIPLHAVGRIDRMTIGGDFWRLFYVPPEARTKWTRAKLILKLIFGPVLALFRIGVFVIMLSKYNGAFAVFFWECIATVLLYQAHVHKEAKYLEPTMALLWLAFLVNLFAVWYCSPATGRADSVTLLGTNGIRKLELDSETRIPREKVRRLWYGFCVSAILIVLSSILVTFVSDSILDDIVIYNFDQSWKQNYKNNQKFIMCDGEGSSTSSSTDEQTSNYTYYEYNYRRMIPEFSLRSVAIKDKYSNEYEAFCKNNNNYALSIAVALCSIDWFLLLILGVYWHMNDKYQVQMDYNESAMLWHQYTRLNIHSVPSKITWLGRVIGRHTERLFWFYISEQDAELVSQFLTKNVPWYANLHAQQIGAKELLPRLEDVDMNESNTPLSNVWFSLLDKVWSF